LCISIGINGYSYAIQQSKCKGKAAARKYPKQGIFICENPEEENRDHFYIG